MIAQTLLGKFEFRVQNICLQVIPIINFPSPYVLELLDGFHQQLAQEYNLPYLAPPINQNILDLFTHL